MCLICHKKLSDETVLSDLKRELEKPNYADWTEESVTNLYITAMGVNGIEARDCALLLLERFADWSVAEGTEIGELPSIISRLRRFDANGITRKELRYKVYNTSLFLRVLAGIS